MYEYGEYRCLTRDEYVDIVCDFVSLLPPSIIIHRLTGDPHYEELVAPMWSLEKQINLETIRSEMERKGVKQGGSRNI